MNKHRASPWRDRLARIGWAAAEALIGASVGLLAISLWLRGQ